MTRIIAGTHGGRRLQTPAGDGTRPTTDRVREALFSSLISELGDLEGIQFLDLFAGSGAIGLEAASRGAAHVDLVERDRRAGRVMMKNVQELEFADVRVHSTTAEKFVHAVNREPYDVIFCDPPYAYGPDLLADVLRGASAIRADGGIIVVERSARDPFEWPEGLAGLRDKKYGETVLWYGH